MNFDGKQQFDKLVKTVTSPGKEQKQGDERKQSDEITKAIQDLKEYSKQVRRFQHKAVKNMCTGDTKTISSVTFRLIGPAGKISNDLLSLEICIRTEKKVVVSATVPAGSTSSSGEAKAAVETVLPPSQPEESPEKQILKAIQSTKEYLKQSLKVQHKAVKNMFNSETKSNSCFVFRMLGPPKVTNDILVIETFIKTEKKCALIDDSK